MSVIGHGVEIVTSSTRPTSPFDGMQIYETDTKKVLVYNGSAWVEVSDLDSTDGVPTTAQTKLDNIGLVHLATNTFSSAASTEFADKFTSNYPNYLIQYDLIASASAPSIRGRYLGTGSTQRTTNNYFSVGTKRDWNGTESSLVISGGDNSFIGEVGNGRGSGQVWLWSPELNRSGAQYSIFWGHNNTVLQAGWVGTQYNVPQQHNGFHLYVTSGTITGEAYLFGFGA